MQRATPTPVNSTRDRDLIRDRLARADGAPSLEPAQLERVRRRFQLYVSPPAPLSPRRMA